MAWLRALSWRDAMILYFCAFAAAGAIAVVVDACRPPLDVRRARREAKRLAALKRDMRTQVIPNTVLMAERQICTPRVTHAFIRALQNAKRVET